MTAPTPPAPIPSPGRIAVFALSVLIALVVAAGLNRALGLPMSQAAFFPLLVVGAALIARSSIGALAFIAFSIMPLGVIQYELGGVTFNLPEALILLLAAKEAITQLRGRAQLAPRLPWRAVALFLFAVAAGLATGFLRGNGIVAVLQDGRQFSEFIVLFWLAIHCVRTREEAGFIALAFVAGAAAIAVHGISQQFTYSGISEKQIASDLVLYRGVRSGSFYGATALGGMLVLACGPALGLLLGTRRRNLQTFLVLAIVLCLFALFFTKTRGSWLGLGVALTVIAIHVRPSKRVLAGAGALACVFAVFFGPMIAGRLATLADPYRDQSLMDRAQYYAAAWHIGRAHPVLGLGWGCYYSIPEILQNEGYLRVERPDADTLAEAAEEDPAATEVTVHSAYLQLFVKTGALGAVGFFAIVLVWLERAWRARHARRDADPAWALYAGITAGLAGYLFHSTFENFFQWPVMAQSFWLLLGLSFALAPGDGQNARFRVPALALGAAGLVFALFMGVCVRLERLHTDNFEQNVARALEQNDLDTALLVAGRAVELEVLDPMPRVVYGRVLMLAGREEEGLAWLRRGAGEIVKPDAPVRQDTGKAAYFAPARLSLGKHALEVNNDLLGALTHFEMARADADLGAPEFETFHPVLYRAYAARGRWDRALLFGMPDAETLATQPPAVLRDMGRILADAGRWNDLNTICALLDTHPEFAAVASRLRGLDAVANGAHQAAADHFAAASADPEAMWLRGEALNHLGDSAGAQAAWRAVPPHAVYRTLALARAAALGAPVDLELKAALEAMRPVEPAMESTPRAIAVAVHTPDLGAGGSFPLLVRWAGVAADPAPGTDRREATVPLNGTGDVLQLTRVENGATWEGVAHGLPGDDAVPGWVDAGRMWYGLRAGPGFTLRGVTDRPAALVLDRLSWMTAVPRRTAPGQPWLILGTVEDGGAAPVFDAQVFNKGEVPMSHQAGTPQTVAPGTMQYTHVMIPGPDADLIRIAFESRRDSGEAALSDAALIPLRVPGQP